MKLQHYAIIFLFIIVPFSIVCRNVINNKILNLKDETRYNNIIDNATYDAVNIIHDMAGLEGTSGVIYGKNVPISERGAMQAINRFFDTLCVNFNLPTGIGESYFDRYVPAIIIVGYDGLYVYSVENTGTDGYQFKLKPKIPYSASYTLKNGETVIFNYTLDNYLTIYFADNNDSDKFGIDYFGVDGENASYYTKQIRGYVGTVLDTNFDYIDDFDQYTSEYLNSSNPPVINPHGLKNYPEGYNNFGNEVKKYLATITAMGDANSTKAGDLNRGSLSYFLFEWLREESLNNNTIPSQLGFLITNDCVVKSSTDNLADISFDAQGLPIMDDSVLNGYNLTDAYTKFKNIDFTTVNKDYTFDNDKKLIGNASAFHQMRRATIIKTITDVMREEFNEHNEYSKMVGVTYKFNIPDISNDQWNNTIDDVSVLAFMQGMPMGGDVYYNNYSLGGARIVKSQNIFCEIVDTAGSPYDNGIQRYHRVYHKPSCPLLIRAVEGGRKTVAVYAEDEKARNAVDAIKNNNAGEAYPALFAEPIYYNYNPGYVNQVEHYERGKYPDGVTTYNSSGIVLEELTEERAIQNGFMPCSVCM